VERGTCVRGYAWARIYTRDISVISKRYIVQWLVYFGTGTHAKNGHFYEEPGTGTQMWARYRAGRHPARARARDIPFAAVSGRIISASSPNRV